jgi:enterochelin esterase-like enzyme
MAENIMKRFVSILFILLVSVSAAFSAGGIRVRESIGFFSRILNMEVKYSVCLPEDYFTSGKKYPVVYLLHGLGDDESSWLEYGSISQEADRLAEQHEICQMIFVMPQGFRNYYVNDYAGTFLYQDMFTKELVPLIDSLYRTIPDALHRAAMGYSMGGFGALILPLKHPELFSVCVPLSISIRTDSQYMTEDGSEWDQQWGRLFGGVGTAGEARITDYYRKNCPFHIFADEPTEKFSKLRIYICNGDDEHTLCRSNEELHILMRNRSVPHEYRVRNGGHEFAFWRDAVPDGLRFISDSFNGKSYRGDQKAEREVKPVKLIMCKGYDIMLPREYEETDRYYPVIGITGSFSYEEKAKIAGLICSLAEKAELAPVIVVFTSDDLAAKSLNDIINEAGRNYRIRQGYRFRAVIAFGSPGADVFKSAVDSLIFTCCSIFDSKPDPDYCSEQIKENEQIRRTWFYICSPDKGRNYAENGELHILLRESDIYHEYRVSEGTGGFDWFFSGLAGSLNFSLEKIHH